MFKTQYNDLYCMRGSKMSVVPNEYQVTLEVLGGACDGLIFDTTIRDNKDGTYAIINDNVPSMLLYDGWHMPLAK